MLMREPVVNLLRTHKAFSANEAAHLAHTINWLKVDSKFWCRTNFRPGHITASLFLVDDGLDHLLLIYNKKLRRWLQPGGHYELGDINLFNTAVREAREEAGILVKPQNICFFDIDVHSIAASTKEPAHLHFDFRFRAIVRKKQLKAGSDATDARWVPTKCLAEHGTDEGIDRMLAKIEALKFEEMIAS
jgi:8-oxo-dGTP pyrophosphatase MutT (NUDIX family)